jgi:outer membrane protein OmpA-like peptidoglycan-associated protein
MKTHHLLSISVIAIAALAACTTVPPDKSSLELARADYTAAQNNPQTVSLASVELKDAGDALQRANLASSKNESAATVDHLSYLARQKVAIAEEAARQKSAEQRVTDANATRDKIQLEARTKEAGAAQSKAREAELRNAQLEAQITELNAKPSPRGYVITFGDVLFGTSQSTLKTGATRNVEKLVTFLNIYPQRRVLIEGFTDSIGSESSNQALSERRANAVRTALIDAGITRQRIGTRGYGEEYPVAGNDSESGRQLNRRVEIVLSDDTGTIPPRQVLSRTSADGVNAAR